MDKENQTQEYLLKLQNLAGKQELSKNYQDIQVQLYPDKTVSLGNFKPSKIEPGIYYAHPTTLRAMKKNIFTTEDIIEDLIDEINCKCGKTVDKQFWHFCPYCEAHFS